MLGHWNLIVVAITAASSNIPQPLHMRKDISDTVLVLQ